MLEIELILKTLKMKLFFFEKNGIHYLFEFKGVN